MRISGASKKIYFSLFSIVSIGALAWSCGRLDNAQKEPKKDDGFFLAPTLPFQDWCNQWGLNCNIPLDAEENHNSETEKKSDAPAPKTPWTAEQWKAASHIAHSVLSESINLSVARQDFNHPQFRMIMNDLGVSVSVKNMTDFLDKFGFSQFLIPGDGTLKINHNGTGQILGRSRLQWKLANSTNIAPQENGNIDLAGVTLSSSTQSQAEVLSSTSRYNNSSQAMNLASNTITDVPNSFLTHEARIDLSEFKKMTAEQFFRNLGLLRDFLMVPNRTFKLSNAFFSTVASKIPIFIENPIFKTSIPSIFANIASLEIKKANALPMAIGTLKEGKKLKCTIEMEGQPKVDLTLDPSFGLNNSSSTPQNNAKIELFGVTAKAYMGAISPSFKLQLIELEPTRIVIKKVPIIGEVVIPTGPETPPAKFKAFSCAVLNLNSND